MRDYTADNITEAVVKEYASKTQDPRMRRIITSLIEHMHAFVKEVELTEAEWFAGIQFLTATGKMCDDKRQEFILLSDTLGVSMLVDTLNHPKTGLGTESTVLGPFYVEDAPEQKNGTSVIRRDVDARPTLMRGKVTDAEGAPIAGATVDVWQTSANGLYDIQDQDAPEWNLRGRFTTEADGSYAIISETPVSYSIPTDGPVGHMLDATGRHGMRPAHVHFMLSADGYRPLTTHIFVKGDAYLDSDAVFATKDSLVADFKECEDATLAERYGLTTPFTLLEYDFGLMPAVHS